MATHRKCGEHEFVQSRHMAMYLWIEEKKTEELKLKELRVKYPALDEAYNHLEFIKALVATGSGTNDIQQN